MKKLKNITVAAVVAIAAVCSSQQAQAFENVDFTRVAESTVNNVVSVKNYVKVRPQSSVYSSPGGGGFFDPFGMFENDPFFEYFFGTPNPRQQPQQPQQPQQDKAEPREQQAGLGSGVILTADGYIVTNNHVIDGADRLEVTLNDNRTFDATVVGADALSDLAVIKINAEGLSPITIGESDDLRVGEWVLAVGNPFGFTSSVTAGIVSAKGRSISQVSGSRQTGIEAYIQTDAAVNPGNSGGALVNLNGELVGINTAIYSRTGAYSGASFAIPTSIVRKVVDDIMDYGSVQRAVMGIRYGELTPQIAKEKDITAVVAGLYIGSVEDDSAAADAGIKEGDVIVAIDGHETVTSGQLQELVAKHRPGDTVAVTLIRDNKPCTLNITFRNTAGNTDITKEKNAADALGATFKELDKERVKELGIRSGLEVTEVSDGAFRRAGIRAGFVIIDINNVYVTTADEITRLYKSIVESDEYDHVMFITGIYPGNNRKVYYAVDLAD